MDIGTCKTCKFFHSFDYLAEPTNDALAGECRAHAPVFHPSTEYGDLTGRFPETDEYRWCGAYQYNRQTGA